jgi:hypothetical protein
MSRNLGDLRTELAARGFDYLSDSRLNQFINDAYVVDVCGANDWPFLEAVSTGTAPLNIVDLQTVESVIDTTGQYKLHPLDRRNITDNNYSVDEEGAPQFYYITGGDTIHCFPKRDANVLSVRYWKVPDSLTNDADEPLVPERFRSIIIEAAVRRAYEDDDEWELAAASEQRFDIRLRAMAENLLSQQHDEPDDYIVNRDLIKW